MRTGHLFILLGLLCLSPQSLAAAADAREIARLNNCTPKKIEVYKQTLGTNGSTTYKVDCTLAKSKDDGGAKAPDAVLVGCMGNLCELMRPISSSDK